MRFNQEKLSHQNTSLPRNCIADQKNIDARNNRLNETNTIPGSAAETAVRYFEAEGERHREGLQGEERERSKLTNWMAAGSSLRFKGMRWRAVMADVEQSGESKVDAIKGLKKRG